MKLLIAYDGSEGSDIAIDELQREGLPAEAEALVASVAEVWLPPADEVPDDVFPPNVPAAVKLAHQRAERMMKKQQRWQSAAANVCSVSFHAGE